MNDTMNQTPEQRSNQESNTEFQGIISPQERLAALKKPGLIQDFIDFKIMIAPKLLAVLWVFLTLLVIIRGFYANILLGILLVFLAPFLTHMLFEFAMVAFAILDTLREIRNKLK